MKPKYLAIILTALVFSWCIFWWVAQGRFADTLSAREASAGSHGIALSYKSRDIGGFPFRLIATYDDIVATGHGSGFGWGIKGAKANLIAMPWNADHVILDIRNAETALSIDWAGADGKVREYTGTFTAQTLQMSISGGEALKRISLDLIQIAGNTALLNIGAFEARDLQFHLRWPDSALRDESALDAPLVLEPALRVKDLVLKGRTIGALGNKVDEIIFQAGLRGNTVPDRDTAALAAWRDTGGTLDLPLIRMHWGPMVADGSGTVAMDEEFRPIGAFSLDVKGLDAVLATLDASANISSDAAELLRITLGLLNMEQEGSVQVPVTLQDGIVAIGPVGIVETGSFALTP